MSKNCVKYDNMFNVFNIGSAYQFKESLDEYISDMLDLKNLNYFHIIDYDFEHGEYSYHISIKCDKVCENLFTMNKKSNKIIQNAPLFSNISINLIINKCELCKRYKKYTIEFGKEVNLGYCPYYENAAIKIQKKFRWKRKLIVLWKIAEYYTQHKYSPNNIMKYIKLDN